MYIVSEKKVTPVQHGPGAETTRHLLHPMHVNNVSAYEAGEYSETTHFSWFEDVNNPQCLIPSEN